MASSSCSTKVCFNSTCKEALEVPRQGWLCRTGVLADLCDRCSSAFKDGRFCDTYHLNASGWRCCESCGKQIHCGCIVSFHMFILLDAGGIGCLNCAKSEYIMTPNPTWPSSHFLPGPAERIRDISSINWRSIAGSGPVPWRQAPSLFNAFKPQHELLCGINNPLSSEQLTSSSYGRSTSDERLVNNSWQVGPSDMTGNRARATGKISLGVQYGGQHNLFQSFFTNELAAPLSSLPATFMSQDQNSEKGKASGWLCPPSSVRKCFYNNSSLPGTYLESQNHSAKGQGEKQGRHQLLPRYWPRLRDQELQQISRGSNVKITPLFEKVLSASDAGKIGRLVVPKKCAEAYLPPISQPEGYPLVVQDLTGKDWVFQFRFWSNPNSRMYVLEGVTPCIQSMQLQAGDTVTFSRLEPEGKLVMVFRKASPLLYLTSTKVSSHEEPSRGSFGNKSKTPDFEWLEVDKNTVPGKRKKVGKMCSNSKHVKATNEEIVQLNVTLEQVQGLLRPPVTNSPTIVLIDGVEFEDYQEEPIIGSPTKFSANHVGSLCLMEVESTQEHLQHTLPTFSHASSNKNKLENQESVNTMEGVDALAKLAFQDGKRIQSSSSVNHNSMCTCNVCLVAKHSTPPPIIHHENQKQLDKGENLVHNPNELYADIIRYAQMENINQNHNTGPSESLGNDSDREKLPGQSFKSQNLDLNIQPEREEECSPVLDMGIMRLVQESTHRYMPQQKLSINGVNSRGRWWLQRWWLGRKLFLLVGGGSRC